MSGKKPIVKRLPKTIKERKWVKEYIRTGNATEAAAKVYNVKNRTVANVMGTQALAKLSLPELMDKAGLTDNRLLEVMNDGLKAEKRQRDFETGEVYYDPDHPTRHRFLETALRIKGIGQNNTNIQNNIQVVIPNTLQNKYGVSSSTREDNTEQ